jgi:outer membrane protein assembly factor BamB
MRLLANLILSLFVSCSALAEEPVQTDWPGWRGPNGDNHASAVNETPLRWNLETGENVIWKTPVPGRGHSTPVLVGDAIFLTTSEAVDQTQSLLKFDRDNGQMVDRWILHRGTLPAQIHPNNSHASPTPAFDGENLLVSFHTDDAIWLTSISTSGRVNWNKKVADFEPEVFQFGYGASPLVEDDLVIIAAEYNGKDSGLYALDLRTGKELWKVSRPSNLNFASPIAATIAGQRQVMLAGADAITAYDPQTGKQFWSVESATEAICGTIVWDGRHVLISGGNPKAGTWCVQGDGAEVELWQNRIGCYEQSLLANKNHVFALADNGVAYCWKTRDGAEMWKNRLCSGPINASPLLASDRIYFASQQGTVFVVAASPHRFELLAENPSGDSIFASPVAIDNRIYLRTGMNENGNRQEYLVAIGSRSQN